MKVGVLGAAGRMGQNLLREILSKKYGMTLTAAVDHAKSWAIGKDAGDIVGLGPSGVAIWADKNKAFAACDVLVDFTTPEGTMEHAALAHQHQKALVVGTTGLTSVEEAALVAAAKKTAVLHSSNMSLGVNLLAALVEQTAKRLDKDYDIEIYEAHHRHKVDAPSGTALLLGKAAAKGRGVDLQDAMIPARFGNTGERIPGSIGFSVFRGGDVIGDHTVTFAGTGERIEFSHKASDRAVFANGALRAAQWINGKPAGLYSMKDVLGV